MESSRTEPSRPQMAYAAILGVLSKVGLALAIVTFAIYAADLLPGGTSVQRVAQHWHLSARDYADAVERPVGWARLSPVSSGENISLLALVFLGIISIICLIRITPILVRERDWVYLAIVIGETIVLAVAATGILVQGVH